MRWLPFFALTVILGILFGANMYLISHFSEAFPQTPALVWKVGWPVLSVGSLVGMGAFSTGSTKVSKYTYLLTSIVVGFLLYLLLAMFLLEGIRLVNPISDTLFVPVAIGMSILVSTYGLWNSNRPFVREITVPMKGLAKEVRAVQITDIHLGHVRGENHVSRIVRKIQQLKPEIIFNTGDLFDARSRLYSSVLDEFKSLVIPHLFIEGNHDNYVGVQRVKELAGMAGMTVLDNQIVEYQGVQIIGLKHMRADEGTSGGFTQSRQTIKDVLEELPIRSDQPTVLLHHSPDGAQYAHKVGVDLYLAGHTHGGQMFPITLLARSIFKYNSGLYDFKTMKIYVSEGLGTFFTPCELEQEVKSRSSE